MSKTSIFYFLVVGGFIGFFVWLGNREKPIAPPPALAAVATPAPAPPPAPAARPVAASQAAPQQSAALDSEKIQDLARQTRVEIRRFERNGGTGLLEVQWSSDVVTQGTDFCDALRREGIIRLYDLGDVPFTRGQSPDGRQIMIAQFKITF